MSQHNINHIAVAIALTLIAMADVHAQTCPAVSSDTTVTSSCDTGITLTGNNNLTIGTPTSDPVVITNTTSSEAVLVYGTGNTINNTSSGTISVGDAEFGILNDGTITDLTNSGAISAGVVGYGIRNDSIAIVDSLTNTSTGTISAGTDGYGILNTGTITTLTNSGTISAGTDGYGIDNVGTINILTNSGTISVGDGGGGIANEITGSIGTLTNSGTISVGTSGFGISNLGFIDTLTNSGTVSTGFLGIHNYLIGTITTLTNSDTISAGSIGIFNEGTITTLTNSGTISAGIGISNSMNATLGTLTNSGTISALGSGIVSLENINTLTNSGTISAGSMGIQHWRGTINTLTNSGTITAVGGAGIDNGDTIGILNNAQGGNGSSPSTTALTYSGNLPTNYNIIINSPTYYGQLAVTSGTGSMDFSIYSGSTVAAGPYLSVFSGIDDANISTLTRAGSYGGLNWTLGLQSGSTTVWDLVFGTPGTCTGAVALTSSQYCTDTNTISDSSGNKLYGVLNPVSVTNAGTISGTSATFGNAGIGIYNNSPNTISSISNSGTISGADNVNQGGFGIYNDGGSITAISNLSTGTISATGDRADGINNKAGGTIGSISNSGTIFGDSSGITNEFFSSTLPNSTITEISNLSTGIISGMQGIENSGLIGSILNAGIISGSGETAITNDQTINTLINSGFITADTPGDGESAIYNGHTINILINSGSITSWGSGIENYFGTIGTLTNTGTIAGTSGYGIYNDGGTIGTLNNLQGAGSAVGPLTYSGLLPTNYNIIINSTTNFGKLAVTSGTGPMTFGIYAGGVTGVAASTLTAGYTYRSVLSGIGANATNLTYLTTTSLTGTYGSLSWTLNAQDITCTIDCTYDLTIGGPSGPPPDDTQKSIVATAASLQNTFALQNSVLANSLGYDCNKFGSNGVCISTGGRYTAVSAANGLNNTSALLIAAYRLNQNYRIGAYADQNLSVNNAGTTVRLGNSTPLIGLFGAWNEKLDGTGTEIKVSAAYGKKNTTVTRQVMGSSEPGSGSSQLSSQGAQIIAKHGFVVMPEVIVSPYVGMRYTQNNMNGYTEGTSDTVTAPLAFSALNTRATTVLAGVGVNYKVNPTVTTFASAGIEADTKTGNGSYSGTNSDISDLTAVNFNANPVKVRASAVLGAYYDLEKNQRFAITGAYRQESYKAVSTTTVMATYTVGL